MIEEDIFKIGASYIIGSHILPGEPISDISTAVNSKVKLEITSCDKIIDGIKQKKYSLGLIETPIFDNSLIYREWIEDELVICSKMPIPKLIDESELNRYRLIARKKGSLTREVIANFLKKIGLSHDSFKSISEIDNPTAIIQSIKWSKPDEVNPTVGIVSKFAIEEEVQRGELYKSRIKNHPFIRKFYIIYDRELKETRNIDGIIESLGK